MGSVHRHQDDERGDAGLLGPTPATYSYNDALLAGKMTRAELDAIQAELGLGEDDVPTRRRRDTEVDLAQVVQRIDAHDYNGALALAERALKQRPGDAAAKRHVDLCRKMLARMYVSALGERTAVPRLAVSMTRLRELNLDPWAGFVVSRVDGRSTIDDIVDVAGMSRLDTLRILYELVEKGVVYMMRRA